MEDSGNNTPKQSAGPWAEAERKPPHLDKSYSKVPFKNRVNLNITPDHPDFIVTERYFDRLFRNPHLTMREILENHFTPVELEYFIPSKDTVTAEKQKMHTELFKETLSTTFKGKLPTLQCKMAMLYFGLRVAPMKGAPFQGFDSGVVADFDDDDRTIEPDPLAFLDKYGPSEPEFGAANGLDVGEMPNLRGGGLDETELDLVWSDVEGQSSANWDKEANDQLALCDALTHDAHISHATTGAMERRLRNLMPLFGRQGYIGIGTSWADFVDGVVWLLGKGEESRLVDSSVHIAIDLFQCDDSTQTDTSTVKHIQTQEGQIYLNATSYHSSPDNEILKFVGDNMTLDRFNNGRRCFVRLFRDQRPSTYMPDDAGTGIINLVTARVESPRESTIYMRTTPAPSAYNCASQYYLEFYRAVKILMQTLPQHYFLRLSIQSGTHVAHKGGPIYVGQDLPRQIVEAIPENLTGYITVETEAVDQGCVPILTSSHQAKRTTEPGIAGTVDKTGISDFHTISELIANYCIPNADTRASIKHVELYLPAEGFFADSVAPVLDHFEDGRPVATEEPWHTRVAQLKSNGETYERGFAIWGRPVFHEYTLENDFDSKEPVECSVLNILNLDLASFKLTVSTHLFPRRYDRHDRNHLLFLRLGGKVGASEFVIRFDTTPVEWHQIKRSIASNRIGVRIVEQHDRYRLERATRWNVDAASYWGPCYDESLLGVHMKLAEDLTLQQARTVVKSQSGKNAMLSLDGKSMVRWPHDSRSPLDQTMREQSWWKPPSIFANPFKPAIPINAPPIEPLLKVGQFMPKITLGVRTPTESAHLEEEVYKLRNVLLSRTRECPYSDCRRAFRYGDDDALDLHLQNSHTILRCPYCVATGIREVVSTNELYFQDAESALRHFHQFHLKHVLTQAEIGLNGLSLIENAKPAAVMLNDEKKATVGTYRYCDRCGRDHTKCFTRQDRENHRRECHNLGSTDKDPGSQNFSRAKFCQYCGVVAAAPGGRCLNEKNCPSGIVTVGHLPEICCLECGFDWSGLSTDYIDQHRKGCKPLCGNTGAFCRFCGTSLRSLTNFEKLSHVKHCPDMPKVKSINCFTCSQELKTPQEVKDHLEFDHNAPTACLWCDQTFPAHNPAWASEVKIQHFAGHMGAHPQVRGVNAGSQVREGQGKCPAFELCGAIVGEMSSDQFLEHWKQAHDSMVKTPGEVQHHPNGQQIKCPDVLSTDAIVNREPISVEDHSGRDSGSCSDAYERPGQGCFVNHLEQQPTPVQAPDRAPKLSHRKRGRTPEQDFHTANGDSLPKRARKARSIGDDVTPTAGVAGNEAQKTARTGERGKGQTIIPASTKAGERTRKKPEGNASANAEDKDEDTTTVITKEAIAPAIECVLIASSATSSAPTSTDPECSPTPTRRSLRLVTRRSTTTTTPAKSIAGEPVQTPARSRREPVVMSDGHPA